MLIGNPPCRDLLNRHVSLTHAGPDTQTATQPSGPSGSSDMNLDVSSAETRSHEQTMQYIEPVPEANVLTLLDGSSSIAEGVDRGLLENAYFERFHPHWPLLHQQTFQNTPQHPDLRQAVLVVGLWMMGSPYKAEAEKHHKSLLRVLDRELVRRHHRTQVS